MFQASLFGGGAPEIDASLRDVRRIELPGGAWIDHVPGWMRGDQTLFDEIVDRTAWSAGRRRMYDRWVEVPRLTASLPRNGPVPPVLRHGQRALTQHYGQPFRSIGLAWYRDGQDSVAPHGDKVARDMDTTVMAIVSCGAPRRFRLTPTDSVRDAVAMADTPGERGTIGASGMGFDLGSGDLVVMGGTIQRTWRHGVPKTTRRTGPRLSIMFRPPWMT